MTRGPHEGPVAGYHVHVVEDRGRSGRNRHEQAGGGRPDHHDPTSGIGGAPPAYSALTLRTVLAVFGLLLTGGLALWLAAADAPLVLVLALAVLAVVALVDLAVVVRRKQRGEPG